MKLVFYSLKTNFNRLENKPFLICRNKMRKRKYTPLDHTRVVYEAGQASDPVPVIHNIVSTAQIKCSSGSLNLDKICTILPGSSYDRKKFAAMTIRLADPNCTILLFSSGKLVVTGGRTWYESILSCLFIRQFLQDHLINHDFLLTGCEIQNIVAHVEIFKGREEDFFLNIEAMYSQLNVECTYQKQMFPGLIYRPSASPIVLLCFLSGKVVITGGKNQDDVFEGWHRLWPVVKQFVQPKLRP